MTSKERNARALLDTLHSIACAYDEERFGLPLHSKSFGPQLLKAVEDWATPVETECVECARLRAGLLTIATGGSPWPVGHAAMVLAGEEPKAPRTDHSENLAKALDHYLDAHDTLSGVQSADEATGANDAADGGFVDKANDAWRALRAALFEYRKHSPQKSEAEPRGSVSKAPQL